MTLIFCTLWELWFSCTNLFIDRCKPRFPLVVNKISHVCTFCLDGLKDCNCSFYLMFFMIWLVMLRKLYLCGLRKHNCQPFCGPEGRFYCSNSMCSLRPAQFSYLCVCVRILGVLKVVCCWANKTWLLPYACCGLHFDRLRCQGHCPSTLHHSIAYI